MFRLVCFNIEMFQVDLGDTDTIFTDHSLLLRSIKQEPEPEQEPAAIRN
jgi:hypothetical protein